MLYYDINIYNTYIITFQYCSKCTMLALSYVLIFFTLILLTKTDDKNSSIKSNLSERNRTYM